MKWNENELSWIEIYKTLNEWGLEPFENLLTASQYWIAYEKFTQMVPTGSSVLDWGCGDGHGAARCRASRRRDEGSRGSGALRAGGAA